MSTHALFYAQSGGATATINAQAAGVIEAAREHPAIDRILIGQNGILGAIHECLIDATLEDPKEIEYLKQTPGAAFGSCRFKLGHIDEDLNFKRIAEVFEAHNIRYFIYNGGNDSQDTTLKISNYF